LQRLGDRRKFWTPSAAGRDVYFLHGALRSSPPIVMGMPLAFPR
jgi:hypothetical protein